MIQSHESTTAQDSPAASKVEDAYFANERREMVSFIPISAKRVLEVGCAEGVFGASVKARNNAEVWGIDLNSEAVAVAAHRLDKAFCGDAVALLNELPKGYFDAIVFNDVLEHLSQPETALETAKSLLTADGVIVASIPNIRYFRALKHIVLEADFKYEDCGIFDRTHLRFFTKKSIGRLFHDCGLKLERIEGLDVAEAARGPGWRMVSMLGKILKPLQDLRYFQFACVARPVVHKV